MKMSIVKMKKEGKEDTEEFKNLMRRLEKTIEDAKIIRQEGEGWNGLRRRRSL